MKRLVESIPLAKFCWNNGSMRRLVEDSGRYGNQCITNEDCFIGECYIPKNSPIGTRLTL